MGKAGLGADLSPETSGGYDVEQEGLSSIPTVRKLDQYIMAGMKDFPFMLEPEQIRELCPGEGGTAEVEALFSSLVGPLRNGLARPPISQFHVAAIGMGKSGRAYVGVNLEFPGLPLHHSVHAEQFLVANAALHGEDRLLSLVVSHAPCGHCRQFLQELRAAAAIRICIVDKQVAGRPLQDLLPHRFGPHDLLEDSFPLLLEPRHNGLHLPSDPPQPDPPVGKPLLGLITPYGNAMDAPPEGHHGKDGVSAANGVATGSSAERKGTRNASTLSGEGVTLPKPVYAQDLPQAALRAANSSYAPYSNSPSGVALLTSGSKLYAGSYMESAAYNPGLPALQAALVALVADGGSYDSIVASAFVEIEDTMVRFDDTFQIAMSKVAPQALVSVLYARRDSTGHDHVQLDVSP